MELAVDRQKAVGVDVGVELRGLDAGMAEHLLDGADVRPVREEVRGEGMAQRVRRNLPFDARLTDVVRDDAPNGHPRQGASRAGEEDGFAASDP